VDIETKKAYFKHCDQLLSYAALRRWITSSQRNPRSLRIGSWSLHDD